MGSLATKSKLKAGLIQLLEKKPLNQIHVNDVVSIAEISRSSFYRNYDTVYDLFRDVEDEFFSEFRKLKKDSLRGSFSSDFHIVDQYILSSLQYLRKHSAVLLALSGPNGDPYFKGKVNDLLREYFLGKLAYNHIRMEHSDFHSAFTCAGHIDVLRYWLIEHPEVSDEEMAVIIAKLMYSYFFI